MEMMSIILQVLIEIEIAAVILFLVKQNKNQSKKQPKEERLAETSKMAKRILFNNRWENIDDVIKILENKPVHINFRLR